MPGREADAEPFSIFEQVRDFFLKTGNVGEVPFCSRPHHPISFPQGV